MSLAGPLNNITHKLTKERTTGSLTEMLKTKKEGGRRIAAIVGMA